MIKMTIAEVLDSAREQVVHLQWIITEVGGEDLASTRSTIEMLDHAIKENITQELTTQLYNLKNAVETTMPVLKCSPEVSMCLIETNETLKKVI